MAVWAEAVEQAVRARALVASGDAAAGPAADDALLAESLAAARDRAGVSAEAWQRALLAHERDARDEIHVRTSDLVHGWGQVARAPVATAGRVLKDAIEAALRDGWAPTDALHQGAVATHARLWHVPGEADPRPRGLRQRVQDLLPPAGADQVEAVRAAVRDFRVAATDLLAALVDAVPPHALRRTLAAQRLTDLMWTHAREQWAAGPVAPTGETFEDFNASSDLLVAIDDRLREIRELTTLLHEWWVAGDPNTAEHDDRAAYFVSRMQGEARSFLVDEIEAMARGEADPMVVDAAYTARVVAHAREKLAAQARSGTEIALRMALLRAPKAWLAKAEARVGEEIVAAAATAALSHQRVIAALVEAVRARTPNEGEPTWIIEAEVRKTVREALLDAGVVPRHPQGDANDPYPYLYTRLDEERDAGAEIQSAIDARRQGR